MKFLEILLLAVLGGFAALCLYLSREYNPTAALFPWWIAIACLLFLALIVAGIRGRRPVSEAQEIALRPQIPAVQATFVLLLYLFGLAPATLIYLLIAPFQMGYRRRGIVAANAIGVTIVLTGTFMWLFNLQLPEGAIWDIW